MSVSWAQAFRASRVEQAQAAPKVIAASQGEVARVLAAKSDLEVMQLQPGAETAAVKKKYRAMTLALHPDKCKVRSPQHDLLVNMSSFVGPCLLLMYSQGRTVRSGYFTMTLDLPPNFERVNYYTEGKMAIL